MLSSILLQSSEITEFPPLNVWRNLGLGSVNFGVKSADGELGLLFKSFTVKKSGDAFEAQWLSPVFFIEKGLG